MRGMQSATDRPPESPRIQHASWGRIVLSDGRTFKDAKLFPGGAREWDWNETGTRHVPGIQVSDILELVDNGVRSVVLSRGFDERLQVCPETLDLLRSRSFAVRVHATGEAVEVYNALRRTTHVGGLFHSTC